MKLFFSIFLLLILATSSLAIVDPLRNSRNYTLENLQAVQAQGATLEGDSICSSGERSDSIDCKKTQVNIDNVLLWPFKEATSEEKTIGLLAYVLIAYFIFLAVKKK